MYLFRDQLDISTDDQWYGIIEICQYLILVYIKAWFTCQTTTRAPATELELLIKYMDYAKINARVSAVVLDKQLRHLWYLSEKLLCICLFDSILPLAVKRDVAQAILHTEIPENHLKRANITLTDGPLPQLVSSLKDQLNSLTL